MIGSIDFSLNSLFVSCNLIGQFCLSDPGNSSRTVNKLIHRYISKAVKENGARPLVGVEPPELPQF